ncbi:MAG: hypothetical protein DHS20C21_05470 [Gemmatimonadota bacterium]|nr:MAG: hypothetical protein DHS20C21_05470 [Gemmatimonadota bacterium]
MIREGRSARFTRSFPSRKDLGVGDKGGKKDKERDKKQKQKRDKDKDQKKKDKQPKPS